MATLRSQLVTAVRAALNASGKPVGLTVVKRSARPAEDEDLPRVSVTRAREEVQKAYPNQLRSPISDRQLRVRLDFWLEGAEPEDELEPLLAWATKAMLTDPAWNKLALDTWEESTEWDTELADDAFGHAWCEFTIRYATKTADQEVKQ